MKLGTVMHLLLVAVVVLGNYDAFGQYVWTKDGLNPVFTGGGTGAWDNEVMVPWVIFNSDSSRYEMWYTGLPRPGGKIGFAISSDGTTWKRELNPVLSPSPGTWDSLLAGVPCVIRENGLYKMWYTGTATNPSGSAEGNRIGYATSPDGRNWTKYVGNPVFTAGSGAWEAGAVAWCSIVRSAGGYVMFYNGCIANGNVNRIGRATSVDGITWQRDALNNPVLNIGETGTWDGNIYLPRVLDVSGTYYLWYTAETVPGDGFPRIGVATSSDSGKTWVKYAQNPVLTMGSSGSWDARWVELGSVFFESSFHMWYDGAAPPAYLAWVGHATSPLNPVGITEGEQELPQCFMLAQNYPNPFNPSTTIRYGLPNSSHVTLTVFNTLGQQVGLLQDGEQEAGYHEIRFDGKNFSSGVYFYRIQVRPLDSAIGRDSKSGAGDFVATKRLLLLK